MSDMPRPTSENTFQVAFKIPEDIVSLADEIAAEMTSSRPGFRTTRTEVLRAALLEGIAGIRARELKSRKR